MRSRRRNNLEIKAITGLRGSAHLYKRTYVYNSDIPSLEGDPTAPHEGPEIIFEGFGYITLLADSVTHSDFQDLSRIIAETLRADCIVHRQVPATAGSESYSLIHMHYHPQEIRQSGTVLVWANAEGFPELERYSFVMATRIRLNYYDSNKPDFIALTSRWPHGSKLLDAIFKKMHVRRIKNMPSLS